MIKMSFVSNLSSLLQIQILKKNKIYNIAKATFLKNRKRNKELKPGSWVIIAKHILIRYENHPYKNNEEIISLIESGVKDIIINNVKNISKDIEKNWYRK